MALQHKSKLQVYREVKWEIGFEEYLEYVQETPSKLVSKFHFGTHGFFEELGRHDKRGGSKEWPNRGACKESFEHVRFERASYDSQRLEFWTI